jgi:catalase (peroxidase I)
LLYWYKSANTDEAVGGGQRLPFVSQDPDVFSNSYYKWLLRWNVRDIQGGDVHFLPTDVVLVVDDGLRKHVTRFAEDEKAFFRSFERAYVRLVSIGTTF